MTNPTPKMSALANLPPTLSVEEAAEQLGIGREAAYQAVRSGQIPSLRIGRRIRIPTPKLLEMLGVSLDDEQADGKTRLRRIS